MNLQEENQFSRVLPKKITKQMLEILPKMSQKFPEKISKNTENLQKEFLKPLLKNSQRNC